MDDTNVIAFPSAARFQQAGRLLIGEKIRDARKVMRLNQAELAKLVEVSRQAISAFEADDKYPDPSTFGRIVGVLQQPVAYFLAESNPSFGGNGPKFYRKFGADTARRNEACAVLGEWFAQSAKYLSEFVNFPAVNVPHFSPLSGAGQYSFEEVNAIADQLRGIWGLGLGPLSNVLALMESKGIVTCRYELAGENVEAFSFWNGDRPFVFIASEKDGGVRSRFDLAHELGHLVLHRGVKQSEIEDKDRLKVIEREANWFAGAFLLPESTFSNEIYSPRLDSFISLKARWKVSIQAMIYRCHLLGIFNDDQTLNLRKQISYRKWRVKEPMDDPRVIPLEKPKLLRMAVNLLIEKNVKIPETIVDDMKIRPSLLEDFFGLPQGTLATKNVDFFKPSLR
ncbi:ImmA/IrrE family metallo-endopeptidase [Agrobacterium vaccinii]|uniref:helix-turn-helix domain-containing protein n=1 Tax=Agrobacterium vaccinii TaxID=2735528 RepID=UPI001E4C5CA7|nr:XRE family transcriptional regulator [Agrobacterium vaccinii]UHS60954.1 ImmA/IrrE family metallo-endopeptidase [Agrobacterium vaccinii]